MFGKLKSLSKFSPFIKNSSQKFPAIVNPPTREGRQHAFPNFGSSTANIPKRGIVWTKGSEGLKDIKDPTLQQNIKDIERIERFEAAMAEKMERRQGS
ncbi:hypothetical protein [Burkholderia plantarii]|uniref:hypothetical protein n=1 Tax=Burkholderia plantarii TaxID=41899 RepID=UPI0011DFF96D|nr:hypothetical protein [Burkholderia plantarii]